MLEKKNHEWSNPTCNDLWLGNLVTYQKAKRKASSSTKKHGKINAWYNKER